MNDLIVFSPAPEWAELIMCAETMVSALPATLSNQCAGDAQELLADIVKLKNQIDKARKQANAPFDRAVDDNNLRAKHYIDPLKTLENRVRSLLSDYQLRIAQEQREALAEQARLEQTAREEAETDGRTPSLIESAKVVVPVSADVKTRKFPVLKVTNFALVPDEYKLIDEAKVRNAIAAGHTVPGAEIVIEERVVAR